MQGLLGEVVVDSAAEGDGGDGGVQYHGGPLLWKSAVVLCPSRVTRQGVSRRPVSILWNLPVIIINTPHMY